MWLRKKINLIEKTRILGFFAVLMFNGKTGNYGRDQQGVRVIESFELDKIFKLIESNCKPNTSGLPLNHILELDVSAATGDPVF